MNFFPHEKIRRIQDGLMKAVSDALEKKKNMIVHAPTGLGKTAATLAPALEYAYGKKIVIFFLTSRHTQHKIAVDTLKKIKEKLEINLAAVSIVGKRWMCSQSGIEMLTSGEFAEYCRHLKEEGGCEYFSSLKKRNKPSFECSKVLDELETSGVVDSESIIEKCRKNKLCPYEIAVLLAKKAKVVIADYSYIFNQSIRTSFFSKTNHDLKDAVIIVDEAHNLPNRVRDLMTVNLSSLTLKNAVREAKRYDAPEIIGILTRIQEIVNALTGQLGMDHEQLVRKEDFIQSVQQIGNYGEITERLEEEAEKVRKEQKRSFLGSVARFLGEWPGEDAGFVRIAAHKRFKAEFYPFLSYRCLDPSLATKEVVDNSYSMILMSGTLIPTAMFRDLLGITNCIEREFESPFDAKNKLSLIIPKTTTKYTNRTKEEFRQIAETCSEIVDAIPGNSAVFFPSYALKKMIGAYLKYSTKKTVLEEQPGMSKQEKIELLEKFKAYKKEGAVLLGVAAGSFGEGIDLPGDLLKGVVVVGLPLSRPDLETKKLIEYYDKKFNKGWDYGYILPAITKCLQNAGRCVRSETDRGVIIFLDKRYCKSEYIRCFPKSWELKICLDYLPVIEDFFKV